MKLNVLLAALLAVVSNAFAQNRSVSEAIEIAGNFIEMQQNPGEVRLAPSRRTPVDFMVTNSSEFLPDAGLAESGESFYVLNRKSGSGFVIVATDSQVQPVIGYSDQGSLDPDRVPENLKGWLLSYVQESRQKPEQPVSLVKAYSGSVAPLCSTLWGQETPFNDLCPVVLNQRTLTGCVATAMSQIMKKYSYPAAGKGTIEYVTGTMQIPVSEDLSKFTFAWDMMLDDYSSVASTDTQRVSVARLMYAAGLSADMDYDLGASASNSANAIRGFVRNFGYDSDMALISKDKMTIEEWHEFLMTELRNGRPMIYDGVTSRYDGHAFIMDGYYVQDNEPYYHINWGWEGLGNGYFRLSNMKAQVSGAGDYSNMNSAIINIMPDNGMIDRESLWQSTDINIYPSKVAINQKPTLTVAMGDCFNVSNRKFSGYFKYYLIAENGKEFLLGKSDHIANVVLNSGFSGLSFSFGLPSGITEGVYHLEARSIPDGGAKEQRIYCGNGKAEFVVGEASNIYYPELMCTGIDSRIAENGTITMSVKNILNYAAMSFSGKISMALADEEGNILSNFGSTENLSNLGRLNYLDNAKQLSGTIPTGMSNGVYRVYVVANQTNFEGWAKLTRYSIVGNSISDSGRECYLPIEVKNGKVTQQEVEEQEYYPEIMVTDFAVKSFDTRTGQVSINFKNPANLGSEYFAGTVCVAVADQNDKVIAVSITDQFKIPGLGSYSMMGVSSEVKGTIPESVLMKDGTYRLCLAAHQDGCKGYAVVKKYALDGGYISEKGLDAYKQFWVEDRQLSLEVPSSVEPVVEDTPSQVFDILGRSLGIMTDAELESLKPGIYIVDGKKRVVR